MAEPADTHDAVRAIVDAVRQKPVATLRGSPAARMLQPRRFGGAALPVDAYVAAVCEIGALDAAFGRMVAMCNAAAHEIAECPGDVADEVWAADPEALIANGYRADGALDVDDRLTGRWESVAGAEHAEWLLLSIAGARRVLVPHSAVHVDPTDADGCEVSARSVRIDRRHVFPHSYRTGVVAAAGMTAVVAGTADGMWRRHVDQMRHRLATSHGGYRVTNPAAAQLARTASDIDAAKLQIAGSLEGDVAAATWAHRQALTRACDAADRLLAAGRHALDASDPVTRLWTDTHAGARLAARLLEDLNYQRTQAVTE